MAENKDSKTRENHWDRPTEQYGASFCANTYANLHAMLKRIYLTNDQLVNFFYELGYTKQCDRVVDFSDHRREIDGILADSTLDKIKARDLNISERERSNMDYALMHSKHMLLADVRWNRFAPVLFLKTTFASLFSFSKK